MCFLKIFWEYIIYRNMHCKHYMYIFLIQAHEKWYSVCGLFLEQMTSLYVNTQGYVGTQTFLSHSAAWFHNDPRNKIHYVAIFFFWPGNRLWKSKVWLLKEYKLAEDLWNPCKKLCARGKRIKFQQRFSCTQQGEPCMRSVSHLQASCNLQIFF